MKNNKIFEITEEDYEDIYIESNLSRTLDDLLAYAKSEKHSFAPWVPVVGLTGSGKTSIIKSWLKHNKLKNWYISGVRPLSKVEVEYLPDIPNEPSIRIVSGEELKELFTPKTKTVNVLFSSEEIDNVDEETVIVIDDYDRASEEVRKELFNLIGYHRVVDPRADNEKKIKVLKPLILIVVIDASNLDVLNNTEKHLFGIETK